MAHFALPRSGVYLAHYYQKILSTKLKSCNLVAGIPIHNEYYLLLKAIFVKKEVKRLSIKIKYQFNKVYFTTYKERHS